MHIEEAIWIKQILAKEENISPILNIGSSTHNYRTKKQPFIYKEIFGPLAGRNVSVIHTDIKIDEGVDYVGDILDAEFRKKIRTLGIKSIICSNLLEHIEDVDRFWDGILDLLQDRGLLIVTVPFRYPKHMDPIDTLYRPSPEQIIERCGSVTVVDARLIKVGRPIVSLLKNPIALLYTFARVLVPFYRHQGWITAYNKLLHSLRMREISCVAIRK